MRVGLYDQALIFLCNYRPLWEIYLTSGVVFTLFTEIGFTFLVWGRHGGSGLVTCSILLHLGIGLVMGLTVFSLLMLTMVLAFVPPDVMRVFVDDLLGKRPGWFQATRAPTSAARRTSWC